MSVTILPQNLKINQENLVRTTPLGISVNNANNSIVSRVRRYRAQDEVQKILQKYTHRNEFKGLKSCMNSMITSEVQVWLSKEHNKAFYAHLATCSNTWVCPVCSAKIMSKRAKQVSQYFYHAYNTGYKAVMLTLTHPHAMGQRLADNMDKHNTAVRSFFSGADMSRWRNKMGYIGMVKTNEVTYGQNGWHFHSHILMFVDKNANIEAETQFITDRWLKKCKSAGFKIADVEAFKKHGTDIMDDCHATDYLTKYGQTWGADRELFAGQAKKGAGRSPIDLALSDDEKDHLLFIEFVRATKGKRIFQATPSLRDRFGIEDKTDEELNAEQEDKASLVAELDRLAWRIVRENRIKDEVLEQAEEYGFDGVYNLLLEYGIRIQPPDR